MDCPSAGSGLRTVGSPIKPTPLPVSELLGEQAGSGGEIGREEGGGLFGAARYVGQPPLP